MKLNRDIFNMWIEWANKIQSDLTQIINNKQIYNYFIEIANTNLKHIKKYKGILFCNFVRECYAAQAAMGIRRHAKIDNDSISLMKLLEQIKKCAKQFTYDFYLGQHPISGYEWQKQTFQKFSENDKFISENMIDKDMGELREISRNVTDFVDRTMAHLDKRSYKQEATYDDLEQAIASLNKLACKYITFITAKGYPTLQATINFDWKEIFTVPLNTENPKQNLALQ